MSFQANVLRVMIASPGDVPEARKAVTEEIYRVSEHVEALPETAWRDYVARFQNS